MVSLQQNEIAERIGELLAQSNLDESIKELILDGLAELPESMVTNLLGALESENDQVEKVATDIERYLADQESRWQDVENDQKNIAERFLDDMAQTLDDQSRIQELKDSI